MESESIRVRSLRQHKNKSSGSWRTSLGTGSVEPRWTHVLQHEIKTPPGVVIHQRPYQVPEAHHQAIETEVACTRQAGVIEESTSLWSSPIITVPKPNRNLWLCNDFKKLNQVSELDSYPMPWVEDFIECLGRAHFISTLDCTKAWILNVILKWKNITSNDHMSAVFWAHSWSSMNLTRIRKLWKINMMQTKSIYSIIGLHNLHMRTTGAYQWLL